MTKPGEHMMGILNGEDLLNQLSLSDDEEEEKEKRQKDKDREEFLELDTEPIKNETKPMRVYKSNEVCLHYNLESCWLILADRVYDVSSFTHQHPAGEEIILEHAGHDATVPFQEVGHSKDAQQTLEQYCIGVLADSDCVIKK